MYRVQKGVEVILRSEGEMDLLGREEEKAEECGSEAEFYMRPLVPKWKRCSALLFKHIFLWEARSE